MFYSIGFVLIKDRKKKQGKSGHESVLQSEALCTCGAFHLSTSDVNDSN